MPTEQYSSRLFRYAASRVLLLPLVHCLWSRWARLLVRGLAWLLLSHDLVLVSLLTCKSCLAAAWWSFLAVWVPVGTPLVFFMVLSVVSDPCFAATFVLNHVAWSVMLSLCISL